MEHKTHPRFVIGESTIVITTFNFNYLGKTYKIPELDGLRYSNFFPYYFILFKLILILIIVPIGV